MDKKLLQQHALPTIEAYGYTTETLLRALDMDEFLPGPLGPPAKLLGGPRVSRRAIRAGRCLHSPLTAACMSESTGRIVHVHPARRSYAGKVKSLAQGFHTLYSILWRPNRKADRRHPVQPGTS